MILDRKIDNLLDRIHTWIVLGNPMCKRILLHPDDRGTYRSMMASPIYGDKARRVIDDRPVEWL